MLYINASAASFYPIKMLNFGCLFFFSPMCIAFKTVVCILLIVRAAFLDDGLKKIRVLFWVVAVLRPSGLEGSVSSGSLWPGAEQKRDPGLKMAADRQVQPTEPDKGTNDTQRCHHLWRKKQKKKPHTSNSIWRLAKKAVGKSKHGSHCQIQKLHVVQEQVGLYIRRAFTTIHPSTPADLPLEC